MVTRDQATRVIEAANDDRCWEVCRHGHFDCSYVKGGTCYNEAVAMYPGLVSEIFGKMEGEEG